MATKDIGEWMAEVRRDYAPPPGEGGAKMTTCDTCGHEFWQWERSYKTTCVDCAADRQRQAISDLQRKEGPMYEKWLRSRYRSTVAEMERLGITPEA